MPDKGPVERAPSPWKLLSWTALIGLVFGLIGFGEIAEDWLRIARNGTHWHKASGDIVLVDVDDSSLRQLGPLPWKRGRYAELVDRLSAAGANRVFIDIMMDGATDPKQDRQFTRALADSGRVVLPALARYGPRTGSEIDRSPLPQFSRHAQIGSVTFRYNYQSAVWSLPYGEKIKGRPTRSFSALLANNTSSNGYYMVDYSIDPMSIPRVPVADVLGKNFNPAAVAGKDVVVGVTSQSGSDIYFVPGTGLLGGAYIHIMGAETLKFGTPLSLGWVPAFIAALLVSFVAATRRNPSQQVLMLAGASVILLVVPIFLEVRLIYFDITPALFVLLVVSAALARRRYNVRGLINPVSSLPNLNALRGNNGGRDKSLIAARVLNYDEILSTLPPNSERQLVEQIVGRINVGAAQRTV